jgi:DNA-binding response OmpR family regulator
VFWRGRMMPLSAQETRLFLMLRYANHRVVTSEDLCREIFGVDAPDKAHLHTLHALVSRLRIKLRPTGVAIYMRQTGRRGYWMDKEKE